MSFLSPRDCTDSRGQLRVSAALGVGFDTNVLLVEEDVAQNTSVSDRGSFFLNPAAQVGYVGKAFGTVVDTRYVVSFTDYMSASAKSYNSLYQRADFIWGAGEQRWGVFGDVLFMNRSPFQLYDWTGGVVWIQNHKIDSKSAWDLEIPLRYQSFPLDANSGAVNDRTGEGLTVKVRYRSAINQAESWTVQANLDQQFAKGSNYQLTALSVPAFWALYLPFFRNFDLMNTFTAEIDTQYYWAASPNRRDMTLKGGLGLIRRFGTGWNTSLDYLFSKNLSTVTAARYTKEVIALSISKDLL